jgi:hypothetical protein
MSINFFRPKSCSLWDNVEKYDTTRLVTDDSIILRMRIECWIPKVINILSENVIPFLFYCSIGCTNVLQCYALLTLPVLFLTYHPT